MLDLTGHMLGRYQIDQKLGQGGMGAVYRARDVTLQRDVAIKIMHTQFAVDPTFQQRFLQEARTAARLDHPGIVRIFDFDQTEELYYIVMEFIPGDNLYNLLGRLRGQNKALFLPEAAYLIRQIALAVDYAHRHGVLHRDLKPANIMLKPDPTSQPAYRPLITDMGLAKLDEGSGLTQTGTAMGTPAYMAPEQALGGEVGAAADIYALGVMLYELTVGEVPYKAKTLSEAIHLHHRAVPPPPPRSIRQDLSESIEAVIVKAMAREPADRFTSASALARALDEVPAQTVAATTVETSMDDALSLLTVFEESVGAQRGPSVLDDFPATRSPSGHVDRIQILGKSGKAHSLEINTKIVTIGRGSDNVIMLDDPKVSRYHARIDYDGLNYSVTDLASTNGVYLGSIKLLPNVAQEWTQETALQIGDHYLKLERNRPVTSVLNIDRDRTIPEDHSTTSEAATGLVIRMDQNQLWVEPGSRITTTLSVINQSELVDHFQLAIKGIPANWVPDLPPSIRLMPGEEQQLTIAVQPPRVSQSRAGVYPLTVALISRQAGTEVAHHPATLTVNAFHQAALSIRPQRQSSLNSGEFTLTLANPGNADLAMRFEAIDPEDACTYEFDPAEADVAAGTTGTISLTVHLQSDRRPGEGVSHHFTVTALPIDGAGIPCQTQGEWVQTAPTMELSLRPQRQTGINQGTYTVQVANESDAELVIRLEAETPEDNCLFTLETNQVLVPAHEERTVQLNVRPKVLQSTTTARTFPFVVTAWLVGTPDITREVRGEFVETPPDFAVEISPKSVRSIARGTYKVVVHNQSGVDSTVQVQAEDNEGRCIFEIDPAQVVVPAGKQRSVELIVQARVPLPSEEVRTYTFTVTARSVESPGLSRQVTAEWIQAPPAFELNLHPQRQRKMTQGSFTLEVRNLSDANLTLDLNAADPEDGCGYTFEPTQLAVPAGQVRNTQLRVAPRKPLRREQLVTYSFTVKANPVDSPGIIQQVKGEWLHVPPMFDLSLHPEKVRSAGSGAFTVHLVNQADDELTIDLEAVDPAAGGKYDFQPAKLAIAPGQEGVAKLTVQSKSRPPAGADATREFPFTILARPAVAPGLLRQVRGTWEEVATADKEAPASRPSPTLQRHWLWATFVLLVCLALSALSSLALNMFIVIGGFWSLIGWAVFLVGAYQSFVMARRALRGERGHTPGMRWVWSIVALVLAVGLTLFLAYVAVAFIINNLSPLLGGLFGSADLGAVTIGVIFVAYGLFRAFTLSGRIRQGETNGGGLIVVIVICVVLAMILAANQDTIYSLLRDLGLN